MESLDTSSNYMEDVTKANSILHFTRRQLGTVTPKLFLTPFKAYSRPHLEFHNVNAENFFIRHTPLIPTIEIENEVGDSEVSINVKDANNYLTW